MTLDHPPIIRILHWPDEAACARDAECLARSPAIHDAFITLQGPLGAGKTSFVRHLLRALGVTGRIKSPSYALLEPYQVGPTRVAHLDFYRFNDPREWEDAGLRDLFAAPGLKLVEWPRQAGTLLPREDLSLQICVHADDARQVEAQALTPAGQALLDALQPALAAPE